MNRYLLAIYFSALWFVCSMFAQSQPVLSNAIVDTNKCELSRDPSRFDRKLLRLHVYISMGFEDSTLHDPLCPEEALVNMGDPGTWLTEIWADFADKSAEWEKVEGFPPLVEDEQLLKFRKLLNERARAHQMTAATVFGTFYAGRTISNEGKKIAAFRGYGHMGCCSLFVISRVESVDTEYADQLNYSWGDWSVDLPDDCGSDKMLGLPTNTVIRLWQEGANSGRDDWHYDPRKTAEYQLAQLKSGPSGARSAGTVERVKTKKAKVKPPADHLPTETLLDLPSTSSLMRYQWIESDHMTRYVVAVSRPYWLRDLASSPSKVIWAPVASSVLGCAAR